MCVCVCIWLIPGSWSHHAELSAQAPSTPPLSPLRTPLPHPLAARHELVSRTQGGITTYHELNRYVYICVLRAESTHPLSPLRAPLPHPLAACHELVSRTQVVITTCVYMRTTGWQRPIGCLKLQVIFRKRATNYRTLWRKMTCKDKGSCASSPCTTYTHIYTYTYRHGDRHNKEPLRHVQLCLFAMYNCASSPCTTAMYNKPNPPSLSRHFENPFRAVLLHVTNSCHELQESSMQ